MKPALNERRDFSGVIDALTQVGARRRALLIRLKQARIARDVEETFRIVDELVPDSVVNSHDKEMPAIVESIHRGPRRI